MLPLLAEVVELVSDATFIMTSSSKAIYSTNVSPQPVACDRRETERQQCQQKEISIESAGRESARRRTRLSYRVVHCFQD